jgi:hypothetical protein
VNPGEAIGFSVANGPANPTDWVGLYLTTATDNAFIDWTYLNGLRAAPMTGTSSATLQFTAPSAGLYEVRLFASNGLSKLATSGTVTVQAPPTLTINDVTVAEGNSGTATATFTVTLNPVHTTQTVTVQYATADGTATTANNDYAATSGTLTFNPSVATQTVSVTVTGDTTIEPNETFTVTLSNAANAVLGDTQGVGTITNDDMPPVPAVTITSANHLPGGVLAFTIANGPGNATDWVAIFPAGAPSSSYTDWRYLNGARMASSGFVNARLALPAPLAPGTYEIRLYANNVFTLLAQSGTFTVAGGACTDTDGDRLCDAYETANGTYVSATSTGTSPSNADTDGDGIRDGDEVVGTTGFLPLPALGVSPVKKNVLLEYDWVDDNLDPGTCTAHTHRPASSMIARVAAAFAASSNTNPDGSTGITVINDYGQGFPFNGGNAVAHAGNVTGFVGGADYLSIKNSNFAANRNGYFHYVETIHWYTANLGSSGQAEINGDDLIVSLGCFISTENVANTIVHELGHNLGLLHGGNTSCNWKPNYNSVMNYRFQFPGVDTSCNAVGNSGETNVLDYSRGARIALNENNLNESAGVCGGPPIDWNLSGTISSGLVYDLNRTNSFPNASTGVDNASCSGTLTTLTDFNDWANLVFTGINDATGHAALVPKPIVDCNNPLLPNVVPAALLP